MKHKRKLVNNKISISFVGETELVYKCAVFCHQQNFNISSVCTNNQKLKIFCINNKISVSESLKKMDLDNTDYLFSVINEKIIDERILKKIKKYTFNLHDSFLPDYAGINSTSWAINKNKRYHGVTWHEVTPTIDGGRIVEQKRYKIRVNSTAFDLNLKTYYFGFLLFKRLTLKLKKKQLNFRNQSLKERTYFPRDKEFNEILNLDLPFYKNINKVNSTFFGPIIKNNFGTYKILINNSLYIIKKIEKILSTKYKKKIFFDNNILFYRNFYDEFLKITLHKISEAKTIYKEKKPILINNQKLVNTFYKATKGLKKNSNLLEIKDLILPNIVFLKNQDKTTSFEKNYDLKNLNHKKLILNFLNFLDYASFKKNEDFSIFFIAKKKEFTENIVPINRNFVKKNFKLLNSKFTLPSDYYYRNKIQINNVLKNSSNFFFTFDQASLNQELQESISIILKKNKFKILLKNFLMDKKNLKNLCEEIMNSLTSSNTRLKKNIINKINKLGNKENYNLKFKNLSENFKLVCKQNEKKYLIDDFVKLNFKELYEYSLKLSKIILTQKNIKNIVGIHASGHILRFIFVWSCILSNKTFLNLRYEDDSDRNFYQINKSNVKLVLSSKNILFKNDVKVLKFQNPQDIDNFLLKLNKINLKNLNLKSKKFSNSLYCLFTSGSTGNPKGIINKEYSLINRIEWMYNNFHFDKNDIFFHKTPYTFDVSIWELILPIIKNSSVVISDHTKNTNPKYLYNKIVEQKVTIIHFVPSILRIFLNFIENEKKKYFLSSLRYVICSGENLDDDLIKKTYKLIPNIKLINLYGPTEAAIDVTYKVISKEKNNFSNIGLACNNSNLYVVNYKKQPLIIPVLGQLTISGVQLSNGYIKEPALTKYSFKYNKYLNKKIYESGDYAFQDKNKEFYYWGRNDHQVKINGVRIELSEIVNKINSLKIFKNFILEVIKDKDQNNLVLFIENHEKNKKNLFLKKIKKKLPNDLRPHLILSIDKIPLNLSGKVDKKKLFDLYNNRNLKYKQINLKKNKFNSVISYFLNDKISKIDFEKNLKFYNINSIQIVRLKNLFKKVGLHLDIYSFNNEVLLKEIKNFLTPTYKVANEKKTILQELDKALTKILKESGEYIVIHSALWNFDINVNIIEKEILKWVKKCIKIGKTVLIPSFTFDFTNKGSVDLSNPKNLITGTFSEIVKKNFQYVNTNHPIYSFIVLGKKKNEFRNIDNKNCFGKNSVFELISKLNSTYVLIGTEAISQIHRCEEISKVPYRYHKKFKGKVLETNSNKMRKISTSMFVRDVSLNPKIKDNDKIVLNLVKEKLSIHRVGQSKIYKINTKDFERLLLGKLKKNPYCLLSSINLNKTKLKNKKLNIRLDNIDLHNFFYGQLYKNKKKNMFYHKLKIELNVNKELKSVKVILEEILRQNDSLNLSINKKNNFAQYNFDKPLKYKIYENIKNISYNLKKGFDIISGPLVKIYINQIKNKIYIIFTIHHLIVDYYSWVYLLNELEIRLKKKVSKSNLGSYKNWLFDKNLFNRETLLNSSIQKSKIKKLILKKIFKSADLKKLKKNLKLKFKNQINIFNETHGRESLKYNDFIGWTTGIKNITNSNEKKKHNILINYLGDINILNSKSIKVNNFDLSFNNYMSFFDVEINIYNFNKETVVYINGSSFFLKNMNYFMSYFNDN